MADLEDERYVILNEQVKELHARLVVLCKKHELLRQQQLGVYKLGVSMKSMDFLLSRGIDLEFVEKKAKSVEILPSETNSSSN